MIVYINQIEKKHDKKILPAHHVLRQVERILCHAFRCYIFYKNKCFLYIYKFSCQKNGCQFENLCI